MGDYFNQHSKGPGEVLIPTATFNAPALSDRIGGSDPRSLAAIGAYVATLAAPPFCGGFGKLIVSGCVNIPKGDGYLDNEFWGVSATIEGDLGFGTLTVIPAYRSSKTDFRTYTPGFLGEVQDDAE